MKQVQRPFIHRPDTYMYQNRRHMQARENKVVLQNTSLPGTVSSN